jgi:hypothetical protein
MKIFACQHCGAPLSFENSQCLSCGRRLGYLLSHGTISALEPDGRDWRALAEPTGRYRYCANAVYGVCNWLVPADQGQEPYCATCRHNRTIPDLSLSDNSAHWRTIELAKHRLFYTLLKLKLPLATKAEDPKGLAFDFIADVNGPTGHIPVMTGHADGVITINLSEADDVERERQRNLMGEPYRTVLGHFRHEIAHYYWDRLIANGPSLEQFRTIFGDEREDYAAALQRHYDNGPPLGWSDQYVSAYASSHPWEDFAETWAHYLHMVDTLETAAAFGLRLTPQAANNASLPSADIDFDPHKATMERLIEAWMPLTVAVNAINRSMGQPDLYPFVLTPSVIVKISFVHAQIHRAGSMRAIAIDDTETLRAVVSGLRRGQQIPG